MLKGIFYIINVTKYFNVKDLKKLYKQDNYDIFQQYYIYFLYFYNLYILKQQIKIKKIVLNAFLIIQKQVVKTLISLYKQDIYQLNYIKLLGLNRKQVYFKIFSNIKNIQIIQMILQQELCNWSKFNQIILYCFFIFINKRDLYFLKYIQIYDKQFTIEICLNLKVVEYDIILIVVKKQIIIIIVIIILSIIQISQTQFVQINLLLLIKFQQKLKIQIILKR
eukprot:TRINITY_DN224_c3_g2_i1.p3 TRINITY_DN224_c3_g2~~TRINITY_DN224_c3_g2_i1.p3  ORF type:complete len:222 (-),score=-9.04 TRINITY_DN224_c3_g2_i1:1011-1676(-)